MEKIVVNDTNVFIDLFNVGLLEEFFSLPWEIHTTNFVMHELLREGQKETVERFVADGRLHVPVFDSKELSEIASLFQHYANRTNLSMTDCSVWYYAKAHQYVLLTGGRKLRAVSVYDGVDVHGVIHVFDSLVASDIVTPREAAEKLKHLCDVNPRLPKDEINRRLGAWQKEEDCVQESV